MVKSQEEAQTLGRRSPPPPPPPQQKLNDEVEVEEESVAASSFLDDAGAEINQEPKEEEAAVQSGGDHLVVLTDDLRDKIVRQVEYYFSDENLPADELMLKHMMLDKQGFVPIVVIASSRRMKRLVRGLSLIEAALRTSSQLVVSKDGRKVRRLHPLPIIRTRDSKSCTVMVENLPDEYSTENLQKIFADVGKILNITIHDPRSTEGSKATRKSEKTFSNKVATLNDEKNWRSGMRVELLHTWLGKYGLIGKRHKETFSEQTNDKQTSEMALDGQKSTSDDQHTDKAKKEEEEHFTGGKGRHRNRYKNRGRGQQNASGQGHGQVPSASRIGDSKPPPGPRMPDGTRGFTMGRGKPSITIYGNAVSDEGEVIKSPASAPDMLMEETLANVAAEVANAVEGDEIQTDAPTPITYPPATPVEESPVPTSASPTHTPVVAFESLDDTYLAQSIKSKLPDCLADLTTERVHECLFEAEVSSQVNLYGQLVLLHAMVEEFQLTIPAAPSTAQAELHKAQEAACQFKAKQEELAKFLTEAKHEVIELEAALVRARDKVSNLE